MPISRHTEEAIQHYEVVVENLRRSLYLKRELYLTDSRRHQELRTLHLLGQLIPWFPSKYDIIGSYHILRPPHRLQLIIGQSTYCKLSHKEGVP